MSNKRILISLAFLFLFNSVSFKSKGQDQSTVVSKLLEGVGGEESLSEARYIMFSYVNENQLKIKKERTYLYDWQKKDCRFEGETKDGDAITALFNAQSGEGKLYINDEMSQNPELLNSIIELFSEDSYLLFTPILIANKNLNPLVKDPVILNLKRYYILEVNTADQNNDYEFAKLYIDSQTGIINRWQIFNKNREKIHEILASKIKDVGGGLTLATQFSDNVRGTIIQYPIVAALLNVEISKFKNL
jgi:hypothetical protein